jgi:ATP-dependent RNA helicase DeaD
MIAAPMTEPPIKNPPIGFDSLGLTEAVLAAVREVGYETPSPIQLAAIPPLLAGSDVLGQAQTGTGKTAAFALPLLCRLDLKIAQPQLLVLTPTRELAIQVAEAMQTYARHLKGFHVLPVYGGQGMTFQLKQLRRGVHAVVGTPGRIQDHLRRKTLKLDQLKTVVLDEADEMLRMGFIEDVEDILKQMPEEKQVALFSATLPDRIRKIVQHHLHEPVEVKIKTKTATVASIDQRFVEIRHHDKLDALTRILEAEEFDAMLIFVRTRSATTELAERLEARGFASAALSGEMTQALRERTVERIKSGKLDIVVATDVAARGLDVERVSHVVNYDIPNDIDGYIHRIGRTGRAGRAGHAILFVTPRERRMLAAIERATRQPIKPMRLPTREDVADRRASQFKQQITGVLAEQDLVFFERLVAGYEEEHGKDPREIAAALAYLAQKDRPLLPPERAPVARDDRDERRDRDDRPAFGKVRTRPARRDEPAAQRQRDRADRPGERERELGERDRPGDGDRPEQRAQAPDRLPPAGVELYADERKRAQRRERDSAPPRGIVRYRIAVGHEHGVQPGNIVGAIANEAAIDSVHIGRIKIYDAYSTVDLPEGMPDETFEQLQKTWVCGQKLAIRVDSPDDAPPAAARAARRPARFDKPAKFEKPAKKKHRKGPPPPRSPRG